MKIEPLGATAGKIIHQNGYSNILSLPPAEVIDQFKSSGLLLFRGFGVSPEQMKSFSEQFSSGFTRDQERPLVTPDGFVSLVEPEMDAIGPHCENGNTPFQPDAVWFCCGVPAARGGETLVWDGVQIWQDLRKELKQLFIVKRIKYVKTYLAEHWKHFLGAEATIADVKQVLDTLEGLSYQIHDDESVCLEYICSAVMKTRYGQQDAFVNSLVIFRDKVMFEDGSEISDSVMDEIENLMDRLAEPICWKPGDLVMIDNSRFLHGRRAFDDERRQIFALLSYLKF
jgi:Taurine catabolism dioxygenase TauD, TfdA family